MVNYNARLACNRRLLDFSTENTHKLKHIEYIFIYKMSSRDLQQDAELEKQRERYRRKAEENVIRNLRLRDSRMRLIGINEQALKQQVEERDRQRQEEKQADRFDRELSPTCLFYPGRIPYECFCFFTIAPYILRPAQRGVLAHSRAGR